MISVLVAIALTAAPLPAEELLAPQRIPGIDASLGASGAMSGLFSFGIPQGLFPAYFAAEASVEWRAEFPLAVRLRLWPLVFRGVGTYPPLVLGSLDVLLDRHLFALGLGVGPGRATTLKAVPNATEPTEPLSILPMIRVGARDGLMASAQFRVAVATAIDGRFVPQIAGFEGRLQVPFSQFARLVTRVGFVLSADLDIRTSYGFGEIGLRVPLGESTRLAMTPSLGVGVAGAIGPLFGLTVEWRG